jgi:hypothetical protein
VIDDDSEGLDELATFGALAMFVTVALIALWLWLLRK